MGVWGLEAAQQLSSGNLQGRNSCAQRMEMAAVVESFLILGIFSAAYEKMTRLSLLPYSLNGT